jgi:AcrR family transcriptional regulator
MFFSSAEYMKERSGFHSHMPKAALLDLEPRKTPPQTRSVATVEAIHDATIQVLPKSGADRLTTVHVAQRAGVSVGTLYQYFPNKQALLFAVLERHLCVLLLPARDRSYMIAGTGFQRWAGTA